MSPLRRTRLESVRANRKQSVHCRLDWNLGAQYVIGLNAADCATGDALARAQTEAEGKRQVLAALGVAANTLRVKLGESLSSIQRFDVPLAQATTSSLEALRAYSLGLSTFGRGDQTGSIPLFQRAIELDPDFAMAYAISAVLIRL